MTSERLNINYHKYLILSVQCKMIIAFIRFCCKVYFDMGIQMSSEYLRLNISDGWMKYKFLSSLEYIHKTLSIFTGSLENSKYLSSILKWIWNKVLNKYDNDLKQIYDT